MRCQESFLSVNNVCTCVFLLPNSSVLSSFLIGVEVMIFPAIMQLLTQWHVFDFLLNRAQSTKKIFNWHFLLLKITLKSKLQLSSSTYHKTGSGEWQLPHVTPVTSVPAKRSALLKIEQLNQSRDHLKLVPVTNPWRANSFWKTIFTRAWQSLLSLTSCLLTRQPRVTT